MIEENKAPPLTGCDELRGWLEAHGFRTAYDGLALPNECNWYAYKRSALPARCCECNSDKPGAQIVVRPWRTVDARCANGARESAAVSLTGEAGGVWHCIDAYSLSHDVLRAKLGGIERGLVAAWNALLPEQEQKA